MERSEILKRIKNSVTRHDAQAEVYLFGSRARGDNNMDSDWDVLVISPNEKITFDYESELRDSIVDLELASGENISLLVYSKTDWADNRTISPLFSNVAKEGLKI